MYFKRHISVIVITSLFLPVFAACNSPSELTTQDDQHLCDQQPFLKQNELTRDQCYFEIDSLEFDSDDRKKLFQRFTSTLCWNSGATEKEIDAQIGCLKKMVKLKGNCWVEDEGVMSGLEFQAFGDNLGRCLSKQHEESH
jgi:hypothetical protein